MTTFNIGRSGRGRARPTDGSDATKAAALLARAVGRDGSDRIFGPHVGEWIRGHEDPESALGRLVIYAGSVLDRPSHRPPTSDPTSAEAMWIATPPAVSGRRGRERVGPPAPIRPIVDPEDLEESRRRVAVAMLWLRNLGIIALLFLMYQWWGTGFEQRRAQASLRAQFTRAQSTPGGPGGSPPVTGGPAAHPAARATVGLPGGIIAHLQIAAIHLDQFVVEGVGENDLRKGPGHYPGSALLGRPGNAAIAGHRTTYGAPFNRIGDLKPGDVILATTAQGSFLYAVAGKETVSPGQTTVVDDYGDNRLTLTTCTPEFSATERLVVVAALEGPAPAAVPNRVAPPAALASRPSSPAGAASKQLRREPQGFDGGALPLVLLCGSILVGLGFAYRPVRARLPVIASMAVLGPLWFGGLLMLFEQVNRFLPPNV